MNAYHFASIPVVISYWLMCAHFLRHLNFFLALVCFFAPGLLLFEEKCPKRGHKWAARTLQMGLFLGSFEWIRTLLDLVQMRITDGRPYQRLAVILGTVAVFTFFSAFVFRLHTMRVRFGLEPPPVRKEESMPGPSPDPG